MPVYKRQELANLYKEMEQGDTPAVFLVHGERYLCQEVAAELVQRLLPDEASRVNGLRQVDGEQEDPEATLNLLKTYSLFGGKQVIRVMDSRILYSKVVAKNLWEKAQKGYGAKDMKRAARYLAQVLSLADLALADWAKEEMAQCAANRWQQLFGFAKPEDLAWVGEVVDSVDDLPAWSGQKADITEKFVAALEAGIPAGNFLLLVAEAADKRKKLYKVLEKQGAVVDLSVDTGASSAARKDQEGVLKELVSKTLRKFDKKIEPRAIPVLLERVGFHPVAVVMEAEKLALFSEDKTITLADLDTMVGRTREEALYELNETVGNRDLEGSLRILSRLLGNGVHALVLVAGLRNFLRKLILVRGIQEQDHPAYSKGVSYAAFQKGFLPRLKQAIEPWPAMLNGHPFVVYKTFQQAERFSLKTLEKAFADLLDVEFQLKGSGLPDQMLLEQFCFSFLGAQRRVGPRRAS